MPASLNSAPSTPASVYRPMVFDFERDDQTGAQVTEIRVADAADVTALGSGLAVGDILVEHAAPLDGTPVPIAEGQTVLIRRCGLYNGIKKVLKVIDQDGSAPDYMVIEAPDYGTVTPSTGSIRVWLDRYALVCELSIYPDPAEDPEIIYLRAEPDNAGNIRIDVSEPIRDYFTKDIDTFALAISGSIVEDAHAFTALFYRVRIAETYALPDESYPSNEDAFTGVPGSDILIDDFEDAEAPEWRVAVNAVHPYRRADAAGTNILTWETADLADFQMTHATESKALTYAPKSLTLAESDMFRLHYLTNPTAGPVTQWTADNVLVINAVITDGSEVYSDEIAFSLADITSAFSVGIGPADLSPFTTLPDRYTVQVKNSAGLTVMGEKYMVTIDRKCKEVRRPVVVQNLLGGADHYTFTGRELVQGRAGVQTLVLSSAPEQKDVRRWVTENLIGRGKVSTLQKPYGTGTGFDWTERAYKGPNAVVRLTDTQVAPIIIESDEVMDSSGPYLRPITIEFRLGVDQLSQRL